MSTFSIDENVVFDDTELDGGQIPDNEVVDTQLDGEYELDGEFEVFVPEDENLDEDDGIWDEINSLSIDSSMILEADKEPISLAEPMEGDVRGLEKWFFPFLLSFFLRALRNSIGITV